MAGAGSATFTAAAIKGDTVIEGVGLDAGGAVDWSDNSKLSKYKVSEMFKYSASAFDDQTVDTYKFRVNVIGTDRVWSIIKK